MPGAGTLNLTGTITGFPFGERVVALQWVLPAAIDNSVSVMLAIGDNQLFIPGGATLVTIEPPPGNTVPITLKGAPGDVGIPIHPTMTTGPLPFGVAATTFYLNIGTTMPGPVQIAYL